MKQVSPASAPSGANYEVENLGVHEHWDSVATKRYSRNLGAQEGIELVLVEPAAQ